MTNPSPSLKTPKASQPNFSSTDNPRPESASSAEDPQLQDSVPTSVNNEDEDMPSDDDDDEDYIENERDRTRQCVREFLTMTDKHFVNMEIRPLVGKRNWLSWLSTIHMQLRMHQVWEVVGENLIPLDEGDELFYGYERMKDVGCAVIYANLSTALKDIPCFWSTLQHRDPALLMSRLEGHFSKGGSDDHVH
ncbi:hypothetical protein N7520_008922 [Penicillium odoratum]|uniref:uncharacterized protein n=1 Tax=Penicillium odoratum TaxID=1167516 RepID=UPI002548E542|nr:uncharacterized protein N7520_008922 [Penicillium odoratum]KAJ5752005.1 hypothetical protein N7520_008922 [Penicillium odoratum]